MNNVKIYFVIILLLVHGQLLSANACSCVEWSIKEMFARAQAVFVGTVVANSCEDNNCPEIKSLPTKIVTFKIEKYWKGIKGKEIKISMPAAICCICGTPTKIGDQLLIYAFGSGDDILESSGCTAYHLKYAQKDLEELGEAKTPK